MIELFLIGIGTGNPDHLTLQAAKALNEADVVLIPRKGADKADLAELRQAICAEVLTNPLTRIVGFDLPVRDPAIGDYVARVAAWHDAIAQVWKDTILAETGVSGRVALLVWGDPSLYDSTLRIAGRLAGTLDLRLRVVPGITALQALTAAHAIPLNEVGAPVVITTGRRLRDEGWPPAADRVAVMLDGECSFRTLPPDGIHIWWGANVGLAEEVTLSGPLADMADAIVAARAAVRARHGWVMDIYILSREPAGA